MNKLKVITEEKLIYKFFFISWIAYFLAYMGRLNFTAVSAKIIENEGFLKSEVGKIGTAFFLVYGLGQLISGYLGDKIPPSKMILIGLFSSALCNFTFSFLKNINMMMVVWAINGFFQSMIWTPILRVILQAFKEEYKKKSSINISTTYGAAILVTYMYTPFVVKWFNWNVAFLIPSIFMAGFAIYTFINFRKIEVKENHENKDILIKETEEIKLSKIPHVVPIIILLAISLIMQGVLRDGVLAWIPTYLYENFNLQVSDSILMTIAIPIINLIGIYIFNFIKNKLNINEIKASMVMFILALISIFLIIPLGNKSMLLALLMFGIVTTSMVFSNTMLITIFPSNFIKYNKVSFVSGLLNSCVYIGSGISTYGIAKISEIYGWNKLIMVLGVVAAIGATMCLLTLNKFKKFMVTNQQN